VKLRLGFIARRICRYLFGEVHSCNGKSVHQSMRAIGCQHSLRVAGIWACHVVSQALESKLIHEITRKVTNETRWGLLM
jgi:hypothetical protein